MVSIPVRNICPIIQISDGGNFFRESRDISPVFPLSDNKLNQITQNNFYINGTINFPEIFSDNCWTLFKLTNKFNFSNINQNKALFLIQFAANYAYLLNKAYFDETNTCFPISRVRVYNCPRFTYPLLQNGILNIKTSDFFELYSFLKRNTPRHIIAFMVRLKNILSLTLSAISNNPIKPSFLQMYSNIIINNDSIRSTGTTTFTNSFFNDYRIVDNYERTTSSNALRDRWRARIDNALNARNNINPAVETFLQTTPISLQKKYLDSSSTEAHITKTHIIKLLEDAEPEVIDSIYELILHHQNK